MPKDNIQRAIKKGTGELDGGNLEEVIYEGYGAGGVAVLCEVLTDNRNRTAPEIRKIFELADGKLGGTGCVAWMFERKGLFLIPADRDRRRHADGDRPGGRRRRRPAATARSSRSPATRPSTTPSRKALADAGIDARGQARSPASPRTPSTSTPTPPARCSS